MKKAAVWTSSPSRLLWPALLAAVAALGLWIFHPTLRFSYVWDDAALLLSPLNGSPKAGFIAAAADALSGFALSPALYWRPLGSLSFWAAHPLCGPSGDGCLIAFARGFNYALYAAFALAIGALAGRVGSLFPTIEAPGAGAPALSGPARGAIASALAMALVALHPANAEVFAWISARFDGLLALFLSLAMLSALWRPRRQHGLVNRLPIATLALCFFLAQLSKDGAVLGCSLVVFVAAFSPLPVSRKRQALAALILVSAACALIRFRFAPPLDFSMAQSGMPLGQMLSRYASSSSQAFASLFQPWSGVGPAHPPQAFSSAWAGSLALHLLGLASLAGLARAARRPGQSHPEAALFFAFASAVFIGLIASCLLNASLSLNQDFVWADRYLAPLWPFAAGALALGIPLAWRSLRHPGAAAGLIVFLLALSALFAASLRQEAFFWRDNVAFWGRVARESPQSIKSVNNYANALLRSGAYPQAHEQADRALRLMEQQRLHVPEAVRTAAEIKHSMGREQEAFELIAAWQARGFDSFDLRSQRAAMLLSQGQCEAGRADLEAARAFSQGLPRHKTQSDERVLQALSERCPSLANPPSSQPTPPSHDER